MYSEDILLASKVASKVEGHQKELDPSSCTGDSCQ